MKVHDCENGAYVIVLSMDEYKSWSLLSTITGESVSDAIKNTLSSPGIRIIKKVAKQPWELPRHIRQEIRVQKYTRSLQGRVRAVKQLADLRWRGCEYVNLFFD